MDDVQKMILEINCQSKILMEEAQRQFNEQNKEREIKLQIRFETFKKQSHFEFNKTVSELFPRIENEKFREMWELAKKVEVALEELPPELQEKFGDAPLDRKMIDIVLNPNISKKQRAQDLAAFFVGGESENSWHQLRRNLYPIIHERLAATVALDVFLCNFFKELKSEEITPFFVVFAVLIWIIDVQGDPNDPQEK